MEHLDDIDYIRHPDNWIYWPLLPMKRSGITDIGVIVNERREGYTTDLFFYPGQNIFDFDHNGDFRPVVDITEFVAEGWKVD